MAEFDNNCIDKELLSSLLDNWDGSDERKLFFDCYLVEKTSTYKQFKEDIEESAYDYYVCLEKQGDAVAIETHYRKLYADVMLNNFNEIVEITEELPIIDSNYNKDEVMKEALKQLLDRDYNEFEDNFFTEYEQSCDEGEDNIDKECFLNFLKEHRFNAIVCYLKNVSEIENKFDLLYLCRKELETPKESESRGDQDDYCAMCEESIAYESDMDDNVSDALLKGSSYIINGKIKWLCELCDTENGQQNSCGHYFICGCDKEICEDCENKNSQSSDYVEDCDNEICKNYYLFRKDNCTCDSCGYCRFFA